MSDITNIKVPSGTTYDLNLPLTDVSSQITFSGDHLTLNHAYKFGHIVWISFKYEWTAAFATGSDGEKSPGTMSGSGLLPKAVARFWSYYNYKPILAVINTDGSVKSRNMSSASISANNSTTFTGFYLID